jgi:hypothetical protein
MIDSIQGVEVQQLSSDSYQLRNATHLVQVNSEGFNLYRTSTKEFEKWIDENLIESYPRDPNGD